MIVTDRFQADSFQEADWYCKSTECGGAGLMAFPTHG
jgi:hypothetical protein